MSYDIYLRADPPIDTTAIAEHFRTRPHGTLLDGQVDYDNPDTGVHFMIDFGDPQTSEDPEDPTAGSQITLLLNYNRPTTFAREAAIELSALTARFELSAIDPQYDATPETFDSDTFVARYAETAYRTLPPVLERNGIDTPHRLPRAELDRIWRWNYEKEARYDDLSEDLFLPSVWIFDDHGTTKSGVLWTDGLPMCLPRVDLVMIMRQQTAPRRGLLRLKPSELVEFHDFDRVLADHGDLFVPNAQLPDAWACRATDGAELRERVAAMPAETSVPLEEALGDGAPRQRVAFASVLDTEYFDG